SRVGPVDPSAKRGVDRRRQPTNRITGARRAHWFFKAVGDPAFAAPGKEELHPNRGRERRGAMDPTASPRRSPAGGIRSQPIIPETGDEPGGEGSSGCGPQTKTPPPRKRRQSRKRMPKSTSPCP